MGENVFSIVNLPIFSCQRIQKPHRLATNVRGMKQKNSCYKKTNQLWTTFIAEHCVVSIPLNFVWMQIESQIIVQQQEKVINFVQPQCVAMLSVATTANIKIKMSCD